MFPSLCVLQLLETKGTPWFAPLIHFDPGHGYSSRGCSPPLQQPVAPPVFCSYHIGSLTYALGLAQDMYFSDPFVSYERHWGSNSTQRPLGPQTMRLFPCLPEIETCRLRGARGANHKRVTSSGRQLGIVNQTGCKDIARTGK